MKRKCEQYWPEKEKEVKAFDNMSINFVSESKLESEGNQTVHDLIHRKFELTNMTSGN